MYATSTQFLYATIYNKCAAFLTLHLFNVLIQLYNFNSVLGQLDTYLCPITVYTSFKHTAFSCYNDLQFFLILLQQLLIL